MVKGVKWTSPPGMSYCPDCGNHKPLSEFPRDSKRESGAFLYCRTCNYERNQLRTPEQRRRWTLKTKYDLTPEEYEAKLADQEGRCAMCQTTPEANGRPLAVDHDHDTDQVRGLLCVTCNIMLGSALDQPDRLRAGIRYLARYGRS
jgi:hypothetical protein